MKVDSPHKQKPMKKTTTKPVTDHCQKDVTDCCQSLLPNDSTPNTLSLSHSMRPTHTSKKGNTCSNALSTCSEPQRQQEHNQRGHHSRKREGSYPYHLVRTDTDTESEHRTVYPKKSYSKPGRHVAWEGDGSEPNLSAQDLIKKVAIPQTSAALPGSSRYCLKQRSLMQDANFA